MKLGHRIHTLCRLYDSLWHAQSRKTRRRFDTTPRQFINAERPGIRAHCARMVFPDDGQWLGGGLGVGGGEGSGPRVEQPEIACLTIWPPSMIYAPRV